MEKHDHKLVRPLEVRCARCAQSMGLMFVTRSGPLDTFVCVPCLSKRAAGSTEALTKELA
jgi:hypothetical protein